MEMMEDASRYVRELVAAFPPDVPCTTYVRSGHLVQEILRVLEIESCDVLFLALPGHLILPRARGRLAAYRLRRGTSAAVVVLGLESSAVERVESTPLPDSVS